VSKNIGGFFELHSGSAALQDSVFARWRINTRTDWMFSNGRSALHHLLLHLKPKTFWLPAYCCMSLAESATGTGSTLRYFPLQEGLTPDCEYLTQHISAGDAVLAIDYFGRNPSAEFLSFRNTRPDIDWIEDRAQALLPSPTPWGDYILYSPRKLLGVTDGGIVVGMKARLPSMSYSAASEPPATHPAIARRNDVDALHNDVWYPAYVKAEAAMAVSRQSISKMTQSILEHADAGAMIVRRKANYATLMKHLHGMALLQDDGQDFVPFGFPIRVNQRDTLAAFLHQRRIFAAHHWRELPSPADSFKAEHTLSQHMLTLPCDHRYDTAHMEYIAETIRSAA
jgi:dTDP-4-amino-4,6-dideoxygalactose transaminase